MQTDGWPDRIARSPGLGDDGRPRYELEPDARWAADVLESVAERCRTLAETPELGEQVYQVVLTLLLEGDLLGAPMLQWLDEELKANIGATRDPHLFQRRGVAMGLELARSVLQAVLEAELQGLSEVASVE